eukprot:scaffold14707_cov129-Isochrysis_galbana.AAC.7
MLALRLQLAALRAALLIGVPLSLIRRCRVLLTATLAALAASSPISFGPRLPCLRHRATSNSAAAATSITFLGPFPLRLAAAAARHRFYSAASQPHSQDFTQSIPSRQSGMVQPVIQEMYATVHAAGSSLLGLFSSCTTFDSTLLCRLSVDRSSLLYMWCLVLRPHTMIPLPWREMGIQFPQHKNKHTSQARGDEARKAQ